MRGIVVFSLATAATAAPGFKTGTIHDEAAPIISSVDAEVVPDSYIVKLHKHVAKDGHEKHLLWLADHMDNQQQKQMELRKRDGLMDTIYEGTKHAYSIGEEFFGYSGHYDNDTLEEIRRNPDVEYIEKDQIMRTMGDVEEEREPETEKMAPWGLARISHRDQLSFGTFNKYLYAKDGGEGVDAYVIDTGTNYEHVDFEGRAHWGMTIPSGDEDKDGNGHGTHCSGTIAGKKYGVAKKANVYAVKVLRSNGSGSMADVMKGVEWAAEAHMEQVEVAEKGKRKGFKGSVANMSLGGGKSPALDAVVDAAVDAGLHFAVAAGNDNADACRYSPAASRKAMTVGASTIGDERAYFSNFGKCVDIFAPGLNIESTWTGSKYAINTISGTSMASPHICGLTAYFLSLQPSSDSEYSMSITPKKLKENMLTIATENALAKLPQDTPNLLAFNGKGSSNFTQILAEGGYKVERKEDDDSAMFENIEHAVNKDFKIVSGTIIRGASVLSDKAEELTERIHEVVAEELEHFFDDVRA